MFGLVENGDTEYCFLSTGSDGWCEGRCGFRRFVAVHLSAFVAAHSRMAQLCEERGRLQGCTLNIWRETFPAEHDPARDQEELGEDVV